MNLQHVTFKIFVEGELQADWEPFLHVFHDWVAAQSMPEMMIDVADYRHVPQGPGVVMVGLDADYALDDTAGAPGLRYVRKAASSEDNATQVRNAFTRAADACQRLESVIDGLRFSRTNFELAINDRAVAPNNPDTQKQLETELPELLKQAMGTDVSIQVQTDARKLAGCRVTASAPVEFSA